MTVKQAHEIITALGLTEAQKRELGGHLAGTPKPKRKHNEEIEQFKLDFIAMCERHRERIRAKQQLISNQ